MRLMTPSPGEAYDRLTILNLKIKAAREKKLEGATTNFVEEQKALIEYMSSNHYVVPTGLADDMGRINARLWDLEDTQRKIIKNDDWKDETSWQGLRDQFLNNAEIIIQLNDARADTVQKINAACGINAQEKIYNGTN